MFDILYDNRLRVKQTTRVTLRPADYGFRSTGNICQLSP